MKLDIGGHGLRRPRQIVRFLIALVVHAHHVIKVFFGIVPRLLARLGDINRAQLGDVVLVDRFAQVVQGAVVHPLQVGAAATGQMTAQARRAGDGFFSHRAHSERRVRLLNRFRPHLDLAQGVVAARVGEFIFCETLADDVDALGQA